LIIIHCIVIIVLALRGGGEGGGGEGEEEEEEQGSHEVKLLALQPAFACTMLCMLFKKKCYY
jgi:hypothetical protein